ncbi:hypothetical protein AXF42_Ash015456 [Apostasia shenzhenica]|uniref:Uncharacterized protein n=1 Tax=Apostasia shenzhenica TaxID=1088818 RepID=A0A2H9ZS97_9ASPA|nr:hypothetical protein AXF42_Ash015456 [Apostasia shenzhenica]
MFGFNPYSDKTGKSIGLSIIISSREKNSTKDRNKSSTICLRSTIRRNISSEKKVKKNTKEVKNDSDKIVF